MTKPLAKVLVSNKKYESLFDETTKHSEWSDILCEELNVHGATLGMTEHVDFEWTLTDDLILEGAMNEINRAIQEGRKKAGFNVEDRVALGYQGKESVFEKFQDEIARKVLATSIVAGELSDAEYSETVSIENESFTFQLKRV